MPQVRLQILLRPEWRHDAGVRAVQAWLRANGLAATGAGAVSVSARGDVETVSRLFGGPPVAAALAKPVVSDVELNVPEALRAYVHSVTVAAPHERMDPEENR